MPKISFVYFDVGGVLVKDFTATSHWDDLKRYLHIKEEDWPRFDQFFDEREQKMCRGTEADTFLPEFAREFGIAFPANFSFTNYIVDHFAKNTDIWPIVAQVQAQYHVGLLTDMYPRMRGLIEECSLFARKDWNIVVDSSVERVKKPMPEIYALAEEKAGLPGSEILFIDNREKNLVPARARGWQTFLYDSRDYAKANQDLATFVGSL